MTDNGQAMFAGDNTRFGPVASNEPIANDNDVDDMTAGAASAAAPFVEAPMPDLHNHLKSTPHDPTGAN